MSRLVVLLAGWLSLAGIAATARAQGGAAGEAEAQKCEERIAAVQRDVVMKYETALQDLLLALQKAADLEGALAVRDELRRTAAEHTLTEKNLAPETKLRALQQQTLTRMQEYTTQLVQETLPKLVELKKSLTINGKLDEALTVRGAIERLQTNYLPVVKAADGSLVTAENLIVAYSADRNRADQIYKGQQLIVRGVVGGFRPDAADSKAYQLFLTGGTGGGWVQCSFGSEVRCREEKAAFNVATLLIIGKDGDSARVQKGQTFELRGVCEGFDETVRLSKGELAR